MDFEEEGTDSVGEDFGVASGENAVAEDILEDRWRSDFWAEFLMATRGDDDQGGPGFDPMMESVIGGGIAGVECDEDIWGEGSGEGDGGIMHRREGRGEGGGGIMHTCTGGERRGGGGGESCTGGGKGRRGWVDHAQEGGEGRRGRGDHAHEGNNKNEEHFI